MSPSPTSSWQRVSIGLAASVSHYSEEAWDWIERKKQAEEEARYAGLALASRHSWQTEISHIFQNYPVSLQGIDAEDQVLTMSASVGEAGFDIEADKEGRVLKTLQVRAADLPQEDLKKLQQYRLTQMNDDLGWVCTEHKMAAALRAAFEKAGLRFEDHQKGLEVCLCMLNLWIEGNFLHLSADNKAFKLPKHIPIF